MTALNFDNDNQTPNREELIQMAVRSAQSGNRSAARVMFRQILTEDKENERALLWMAKLAESKDERVEWLQRVLRVNPTNSVAQEALQKIHYTKSARDNRTLVTFGVAAGVLIIIAIIIIVFLIANRGV